MGIWGDEDERHLCQGATEGGLLMEMRDETQVARRRKSVMLEGLLHEVGVERRAHRSADLSDLQGAHKLSYGSVAELSTLVSMDRGLCWMFPPWREFATATRPGKAYREERALRCGTLLFTEIELTPNLVTQE